MNLLDELDTKLVDQADRSALKCCMDAMEQRVASLEQFLEEVANDMLNRTRGARSFACNREEAQP